MSPAEGWLACSSTWCLSPMRTRCPCCRVTVSVPASRLTAPHGCTAVPQDAAGTVTFSVLLTDLDEANCTSTVEAAILAAIEDTAGPGTTTSVSFKPYRCMPLLCVAGFPASCSPRTACAPAVHDMHLDFPGKSYSRQLMQS